MTSTKSLTVSERYARSVLAAWNKDEVAEFQAALLQTSHTDTAMLPAAELERVDLIQEIGRILLDADRSGQGKNETSRDAALALLRHLAGLQPRGK